MKKKLRIAAAAFAAAAVLALVGSTGASAAVAPDAPRTAAAAAVVQPGVNTVGTPQLKAQAVTAAKIAPKAVWGSMIMDNTIPYPKMGADFRNQFSAILNNSNAALTKANTAIANPIGVGAYYAVAFYDVGQTNAGAIATVGCSKVTDTAISGGVQVLGLDATANSRNTPVSSSFPGRMDWSTNAPKANRLDGWIVQFGGNAGAVSDKDPLKTKIWALCVPGLSLPVVETFTESK